MNAGQLRRRFYRQAAAAADGGSFVVRLDGRPLRTPGGQPLRLASLRIAQAVAAEWQAQDATIMPATMPLMQLVATAIDRVAPQRAGVIDELLRYAETDLVCYWAEGPADLVRLQHQCWQPLLDWLARRWRAELCPVCGVMPVAQPAAAIAALRDALTGRDDLALTALASVVQASGSLTIGLALADGHIDAEAACAAALLDETYQAQRWGCDERAERRRTRIRDEIRAGWQLLDLLAVPAADGDGGDAGRE
ncbi:MAG: ATP12 family chaperone protein [Rhodospirillales bacterium]|jgi:chaperone required for assembly of F1-ATPase|nr:ATP12 family chaperone protein [Rhodospirillales bacterium]